MEKHLLIGTLLPGATPINNENINPVWRGNVIVGNGRQVMYVKEVNARTLAVEVICAILGRSLDLPMPRPALVRVPSGALDGISEATLFFGSESIDTPDLKQWLRTDGANTERHLLDWTKLLDAGCFDEWIANADRHGGNIMYGGGKNFALIDHSEAIPMNLTPRDPAPENILLKVNSVGKKAQLIDQLYKNAKASTSEYSKTHIYQAVLDVLAAASNQQTVNDLTGFLSQRTDDLLALIARRIGHKQNSLELINATIS